MTGSITTTGGTYDLTDGGTKDAPGKPAQKNYDTDSSDATDPFYEAGFVGDRTADSATMMGQPGAAVAKAKQAFDDGATSATAVARWADGLRSALQGIVLLAHPATQPIDPSGADRRTPTCKR